jgi:hypothetical protein
MKCYRDMAMAGRGFTGGSAASPWARFLLRKDGPVQCGKHPQPHGRAVGCRYSPIQVIQVCQAAEHSRMRLRFLRFQSNTGRFMCFLRPTSIATAFEVG